MMSTIKVEFLMIGSPICCLLSPAFWDCHSFIHNCPEYGQRYECICYYYITYREASIHQGTLFQQTWAVLTHNNQIPSQLLSSGAGTALETPVPLTFCSINLALRYFIVAYLIVNK